MNRKIKILIVGTLAIFMTQTAPALAQSTSVPFGGLSHDTSQQVEIVSDSFTVSQSDGTAEFVGNVVVGQGDMRLSAGKIVVKYAAGDGKATGRINLLIASGGVTLVSGTEAAEAKRAVYSIKKGNIVMTGDVILTQGKNVLSGQKMIIDLKTGSAKIEGRVKTIFQTGTSK
ncbi:MAG: LPS export ABC transporter periplasmic protein LptC [Alphaproteobacteria bacterium]|nr:LPS export ABC transporter periplasmic protein LptC [Alphaproteobacteria bacterium]